MANSEHVKILKQGVEVWNKWRKDNPDTKPDLREADLTWANLEGAYLRGANLRGARLVWACLEGAHLEGVNLEGANLKNAFIEKVNLEGVNLEGVNLEGAILRWARLTGADLRGVTLGGADLTGANFVEVNLIGACLIGVSFGGVNPEVEDHGNSTFNKTRFSSRKSLISLSSPLDKEQMAGAIFEDEIGNSKVENKVENTSNSNLSTKQKIQIAVENPKTYSEINFRSQKLITLVTALIEYYHNHDNEITEKEREIKTLLKDFGEKLKAFSDALEGFPDNENIDELEKKIRELQRENEILGNKSLNGILGKWNILAVSVDVTAILELMGVPVATAAVGTNATNNIIGK